MKTPAPPSLVLATLVLVALAGCADPAGPRGGAGRGAPAVVSSDPASFEIVQEPWTFEEVEGVVFTSPSYRLYTTVGWAWMLDRLPRFLELAAQHYATGLAPLPRSPQPMETFVMANRPQWARLTERLMGDEARVYLRIQRGGFSATGRAILYNIGPRDTFAIAAHEGWHQYTQTTFRNPLPVWLEEGVASYMEGFRWADERRTLPRFMPWANVERFDALRAGAAAGRLIPLEDLLQSTPQDLMARDADRALLYYAQVWALVHFLNEGEEGRYSASLRQMLTDAAAGRVVPRIQKARGNRAASLYASRRRGPELLLVYLDGAEVATLAEEYAAFVAEVTRVGAKDSIIRGRSPVRDASPE